MKSSLRRLQSGFTLVEIMVVVAVIAMLAAIAVPNFLRSRKRAQATRILQDLRVIDAAIDQYAIENSKGGNTSVGWSDVRAYLKGGSALYNSGGNDILAGSYGTFTVDSVPKLSKGTYDKLSDVAPLTFWSPYY